MSAAGAGDAGASGGGRGPDDADGARPRDGEDVGAAETLAATGETAARPGGLATAPTGASLATAETMAASASPAPSDTPASGGSGGADTRPQARAGYVEVRPGAALGRYQIEDELGAGGMATVFRARDPQLRRDVAIKVMFPHLAKKPEVARRFQREARAAAGLEHPNILRVYDVGGGRTATGGLDEPPHIVMELVRGESLREASERIGPMLAEIVACVGAVLCDALAVAHAAGVIHRDVKPGNVLVSEDGRLLLADFGVARVEDDDSLVTKTGALLGTPSFMSPEQAHGDALDGRSDVYSVGATLYQLATGALPFAGPTAVVIAAISRGEYTPPLRRRPQLGADVARMIERLMHKDPARRPASAADAAAALRAIVAEAGLGEPRDELAAYFADPDGYERAKRPILVEGLVERARAALAARAAPKAMALVDRALAMEPDHAAARALAEQVARMSGGRRWPWLAGAAAAIALGGGAAWVALGGDDRAAGATVDGGAAIVARVADAAPAGATVDAGVAPVALDAAAVDVDAGPGRATGPEIDAGRRPRLDAGRPTLVVDAAAPAIVIDAAPPASVPDAAAATVRAEPATIAVSFDAWCDLSIDGEPRGRADKKRRYEVEPGTHEVECTQGKGMPQWRGSVTVRAGEHQVVRGSVLGVVRVRVAVERGDGVTIDGKTYRNGAVASLKPGNYAITVVAGDQTVLSGRIDIARGDECALRDRPDLGCYR